jgi:hypothetical protein
MQWLPGSARLGPLLLAWSTSGNAGMTWLDTLGWAGSALLVYSVLQARILRFRIFNGIASVLLVVFNASIAVWPMVGLNVVLTAINAFYLMRGRHDPRSYSVAEVEHADGYVQYILRTFDNDIRHFNPEFSSANAGGSEFGYLILTGAETVGVVLAQDAGEGTAQVELDYVFQKYRDFTPGEFVYRRGGPFASRGYRRVIAPRTCSAPSTISIGWASGVPTAMLSS